MKRSAGIIIVDTNSKPEPTVLAVRAYAHWDFPKGIIEEGESDAEAAIRETSEEVSLHPLLDYNMVEKGPVVYRGKGKNLKEVTYYLATRCSTNEPFLPVSEELGKPENDEFGWIRLGKLSPKFRNKELVKAVIPYIQTWCKKNL